MGLFSKMFEKKYCAVCGKELGVFGKTKIADGHLCKDCAGQLSPFFKGHRQASVDEIKSQMAAREANKAEVAAFHVTRTLGTDTKVFIDEDAGKVIVTRTPPTNWQNANPDVLSYTQITGADYEVEEDRTEIYHDDEDGNSVSYVPPRYEYEYDIYVTIHVNHPYVGQIRFQVNPSHIGSQHSAEFRKYESTAREIKSALTDIRAGQRAAAAPKTAVTCPHCGATTVPDASGRCEYCGGALAS